MTKDNGSNRRFEALMASTGLASLRQAADDRGEPHSDAFPISEPEFFRRVHDSGLGIEDRGFLLGELVRRGLIQ